MATHNALSYFTNEEIREAHLTYGEINALSDENFVKLMRIKLEHFSPKTPKQVHEKNLLLETLQTLGVITATHAFENLCLDPVFQWILEAIKSLHS